MTLLKKIFPLLQRVTSSGEKLLYIDGLRFFAVISVFLFHFIDCYDDEHAGMAGYTSFGNYADSSVMGVILFFSISGFLIAMPFYRHHVAGARLDLRNYYFRRLTRLEPPYMLHLLLLFVLMVFILRTKTFSDALPHLVASLFYCHNIVYREMPMLNTVLWTLEIEIQFYIAAPLLALVFRLGKWPRRMALLAAIGIFTFIKPVQPGFDTVFRFIHYFLTGFLALDVYMDARHYRKHLFFDLLCFGAIILLWASMREYLTVLFLYILLVYSSRTVFFLSILENKVIYTIGGMCYSFYMLHQKVIYLTAGFLSPEVLLGGSYGTDFLIRMSCTLLMVLLVSAAFFILVERPTMKRQWWKYRSLKELVFR